MWIVSLLDYITGFIPRPIIVRPDEGGFRQVPKLWAGWPWNKWPWLRWEWIKKPWKGKPWSRDESITSTWIKELKPGNWYWDIPWFTENEIVKIKPQVKDIRTQSVWTKDGVDIIISASIRYYVKDWMKAQLEVLDYDESLQTTALVAIEEYIEGHTLSELKEGRATLRNNLLKVVKEESRGWGLQIQSVGITDTGKARNIRLLANSGNSLGSMLGNV